MFEIEILSSIKKCLYSQFWNKPPWWIREFFQAYKSEQWYMLFLYIIFSFPDSYKRTRLKLKYLFDQPFVCCHWHIFFTSLIECEREHKDDFRQATAFLCFPHKAAVVLEKTLNMQSHEYESAENIVFSEACQCPFAFTVWKRSPRRIFLNFLFCFTEEIK